MKWNTLHRGLSVMALSIMLLASADWTRADWKRLRGPGASGVSEDAGLPTTWSATENVVWKTALPGFGASSPITLGDKIFLTCYSGYGLDEDEPGGQADLLHHVVCLDRAGGQILWDKRSRSNLPETEYGGFLALHGYASGTPVTDGQTVFAFFGKSGVWAYSVEGELLWRVGVGSKIHRLGWGSGTSPILAGDLVIVNASIESESLVALEKATGKEIWRAEGIKDSWSTPLLVELPDGKQEVVALMHGKVRGYDPATGQQLWECATVEDYVCPMVIGHESIVYVTAGRSGARTYAIRAGGRGDVTDTHRLWELKKTPKVPSPLVHDGLLYWVDGAGIACCADAETGEMVYQERVSGMGKVYASVVLGDDKLYAVTRTKGTLVYAAGREFKQLARNDLGDDSVFNATPTITDGRLLLRSDKFLYSIGK